MYFGGSTKVLQWVTSEQRYGQTRLDLIFDNVIRLYNIYENSPFSFQMAPNSVSFNANPQFYDTSLLSYAQF